MVECIFFRYRCLAEFLGFQNLHFDSRLVFLFFSGGGVRKFGYEGFVDIFGVTCKIEFFMFFFVLKLTTGICVL